MGFTYDTALQQTKLIHCVQQVPLKVIRAFPIADGGVLVHLHNVSGGILGGDQLDMTIDIGKTASVQLTSTSATRLYRNRPEMPAAQQTNIVKVQAGGLLEYLPDPLIPFGGSHYRQHTYIELEHDAGLFWWETLAPGRAAHGEHFAYTALHLGLTISTPERPIAIERLTLVPQQHALSSLARLGPYSYLCSFYICRVGQETATWTRLEKALSELALELTHPGEITWGVSTLVAHGLVIRALSTQGRDIASGLLTFWRAAKQLLYGREALPPRKMY